MTVERILLTGATGVIGTQLAADLAEGHRVRSFSRSQDRRPATVTEHIAGDVRNFDAVLAAAQGMDAVVHLAGLLEDLDPLETLEVDLRGTYNVLEAARLAGVPRVVFASSIAVTGCLTPTFVPDYLPIREDDVCRPASAYSVAKLASEKLCDMYSRRYGLVTIALRFAGVQHPETWTEPLWENERCPILWTWISLRDASRALQAALRASIAGPLLATVAAADSCSLRPTRELARDFCPGAIIRDSPTSVGAERWPMFSIAQALRHLEWEPMDRFDRILSTRT